MLNYPNPSFFSYEYRKLNYNYFNRCRTIEMWFYRNRKKLLDINSRKWACKACIHQRDSHEMNCLECCPMQRALDALFYGGKDDFCDVLRIAGIRERLGVEK